MGAAIMLYCGFPLKIIIIIPNQTKSLNKGEKALNVQYYAFKNTCLIKALCFRLFLFNATHTMYLQLVLRTPECLLHWLLAAIFLGWGKKKKERRSCRRNVTNFKEGTLNFLRVMRAAMSTMHNIIGRINTHTYSFVQQTI